MNPLMEVTENLYTARRDAVNNDSFAGAQAFDVAIDLWDGMLKGKVGASLTEAINHYVEAMNNNVLHAESPEEAAAYYIASEHAVRVLSLF